MVNVDRKSIAIIGDSMSDLDGAGQPGYGPGRPGHSVWTRELLLNLAPERWTAANTGKSKKYRRYRTFRILEGGEGDGGSEGAVSASTSQTNLARLKGVLTQASPGVVIIANTGYNDFSKKIPLADTIKNVTEMVRRSKAAGAKVLLIGFPPRDMGAKDDRSLAELATVRALAQIAKDEQVSFVEDYFAPIRINGVVPKDRLVDAIHVKFNADIQEKLLANVMGKLEPLLQALVPAGLGLTEKAESISLRGGPLSNDLFQGRWEGKGPDWRWYRETAEYQYLKDAWSRAGGVGMTVTVLKDSIKNLSTRVSDAAARVYLGLSDKTDLPGAQRASAQAQYEADLFDWWWTTPGLSVKFTSPEGNAYTLNSGVRVRAEGVYSATGKLLFAKSGKTPAPDLVKAIRLEAPKYQTLANGKPKAATATTNSLFIFGDSTSSNQAEGQSQDDVWFAQVGKYLSKEQAARYRAVNYSYSGAVSGDLLYYVRAHIDAIAATPGERTVVLAFGSNDKSDAGMNKERERLNRAARFQTNTLGNLYAAAVLAASRGINVIILRGSAVPHESIEQIAAEVRRTYGVKADAINWTSLFNNKANGESVDGTHRTNLGMTQVAKWFANNSEFVDVTFPKPFKPAFEAATWWRSSAWMIDKINDKDNSWKTFWLSDKRDAKDTYTNAVRDAYAAFNKSQNQATYNRLCELNEQWWAGKVDNSKPGAGETLYFGPDAVRLVNAKGAIYDPDGSDKKYGPLKNAKYVAPVEPFDPKFEAKTWWRSSAWMIDKINQKDNAWKKFWLSSERDAGDTYAKAVRDAYGAFDKSQNQATYNRLCELNERWWAGKVDNSKPGAGETLYFGADAVRLVNAKGAIYDPDGSDKKYGPLKNAKYVAPVEPFDPKFEAKTWWRSSAWMIDKINQKDNAWKKFWLSSERKAGDTYAKAVRDAYAAFDKSQNQATYNRLCELNEQWWAGKVENSKPGAGKTLYFGADAVRLVDAKGAIYDPDGSDKKYGPLKNAKYVAPVEPFKPTFEAATWWRSSAWMIDKINQKDNAWKKFWLSSERKAGDTYAKAVRDAYAAFDKSQNQATYNKLCELNEQWWAGRVDNSKPGAGETLYFGADAVRLVNAKGAIYDPDGSDKKYGPLKNAKYVAPVEPFKPTFEAATWWRSSAWMIDKINQKDNAWKKFWLSSERDAGDTYAKAVRDAYAAFDKSQNQATYNKLCELNEQWWAGKVENSKPGAGETLYFGADAVRLVNAKGAIYDPDGTEKKYGPLKNTKYVPPVQAFKPAFEAATWWRSSAWMIDKITNPANAWSKYWTSDVGREANKFYAEEVRKASAAFQANRNQATYNALCALNELWWTGDVKGSTPGKGKTLHFGADAVRLVDSKGAIYDPDGAEKKYGPLKNDGLRQSHPNADAREILVVGDSLSDLGKDWGVWVNELKAKIKNSKYFVDERAVTGTPTRSVKDGKGANEGALDRFDQALKENAKPHTIVIATGVNNLLRGVTLAQTAADIEEMLERALTTGARVLLIGMYLPPLLQGADRMRYISDEDKNYLKVRGLNADPNGWSIALHRIYFDLNEKYKAYRNLSYINNYFDPIDGGKPSGDLRDVDQSDATLRSLLANLLDKVHPKRKFEDELFEPIWDALKGNLPGLPDPGITPPMAAVAIKSFESSAVTAGRDALLTFNIERPAADSSIRVKFSANIADPRAGDKNGDLAQSEYVNFAFFYVSFDGETWTRYENSNVNIPNIVVPKGTTSIKFRFKTFKNPPYNATLSANVGEPPKTYSTTIEKVPYALFVLDATGQPEAAVLDVLQAPGSQTCYLLAGLQALANTSAGSALIKKLIKTTKSGDYEVSFANGVKVTIKRSEIINEIDKTAALGRTGFELWVRVLEKAYLTASNANYLQDGDPGAALKALTGNSVASLSAKLDATFDAVIEALKGGKAVVLGTQQKVSETKLRANHAYAIVSYDDASKSFTLQDTFSEKKIVVSRDDLKKLYGERVFLDDTKRSSPEPLQFASVDAIFFTTARGYSSAEKDLLPPQKVAFDVFSTETGRTAEKVTLAGRTSFQLLEGKWFYFDTPFSTTNLRGFFKEGNKYVLKSATATQVDGKFEATNIRKMPGSYASDAFPTLRSRIEYDATFLVKQNINDGTSQPPKPNPTLVPTFSPQYAEDLFVTSPQVPSGGATGNYVTVKTKFADDFWWRNVYGASGAVSIETLNGDINIDDNTLNIGAGAKYVTLIARGLPKALSGRKTVKYTYLESRDRSERTAVRVDLVLFKLQLTGQLSVTTALDSAFNDLTEHYGNNAKDKFAAVFADLLNQVPSGVVTFSYLFYSALWFDYYRQHAKADRDRAIRENKDDGLLQLNFTAAKVMNSVFRDFQTEVNLSVTLKGDAPTPSPNLPGDGRYGGGGVASDYANKLWDLMDRFRAVSTSLQDDAKSLSQRFSAAQAAMPQNTMLGAFGVLSDEKNLENYKNQVDKGASNSRTTRRFGATTSLKESVKESLLLAAFERVLSMEVLAIFIPTAKGNPTDLTAKVPSDSKGLAKFARDIGLDIAKLAARSMPALFADPKFWALVGLNLADIAGSAAADRAMKTSLNEELKATKNLTDQESKDTRAAIRKYVVDEKVDLGNGIAELRSRGIGGAQAFDLADGKSFSEVVKDLGLKGEEIEKLRSKIDEAAKGAPKNANLQTVSDNAFKSGLTADQSQAFDELRKTDAVFDRKLARAVTLNPEKLEQLLAGRSEAEITKIRTAIATASGEMPDNQVLNTLSGAAEWGDLTPDQRALAAELKTRLMTGANPLSDADATTLAKSMAQSKVVDWSDETSKAKAVDNMKAFKTAVDKVAGRGIFAAAGGAAGAVLMFVPFGMAIASGDRKAVEEATANLFTSGGLLALEIAAGPVGWAFAIITTAMSLVEKPVESLVKKNPLYLLIPAISLTFAFNKALKGITATLSKFIGGVVGIFSPARKVTLDPLTPSEVAMMAYKNVYDEEYEKSAGSGKTEDDRKNAAGSAVLMRMVIDGVITNDSFVAAMAGNGDGIDPSKFVYDLNKIPASALVEMVAWDVLSSCFDVYEPFYYLMPQKSKLKDKQNREILRAVLDRLGGNSGDVNRDQTRFYSHWMSLGQGADDLFQSATSVFTHSNSGYGFIGEYKKEGEGPFENGAYIKPTEKFVAWLTELFQIQMLKFREVKGADGKAAYAITFGNTLDGSDLVGADKATKADIVNCRKAGMRTALMAYSKVWGNGDEILSAAELASALNDMMPNGLSAVDERWVDFVLSSYDDSYSSKSSSGAKGLDWNQIWNVLGSDAFYFDAHQGGMGVQAASSRGVFGWRMSDLTNLIVRTWGSDFKGNGTGKIKVGDLENALWRLGAVGGGTEDNKQFVQFLISGWRKDWVGEINNTDLAAFLGAAASFDGRRLEISMAGYGGDAFVQAVKYVGNQDSKISADDVLKALTWLLPGEPFYRPPNETAYDYWFYSREDFLNQNFALFDDMAKWMKSYGAVGNRAEMSVEQFKAMVHDGAFDHFLKARTPARFHNLLAGLSKPEPGIYTRIKDKLAPVVLDLDGNGFSFTPLAQSIAQYDVDGSGVRRNVAWTRDALLAFDADGDGRITKTNELSFVGYKPGAKTDLEGLNAFDSNGDGKLSVFDKYWKKFVVWLDRNGDGVSDAGELVSLDEAGVSSIDLTSDKKRQDLDGVTLHGTTTFTTKDGRTGAVGDVSFDASRNSLSPAEIARRRDLLAQALASGKSASGAGVFSSRIGSGDSPTLFMPGSGGR